MRHRTQILLFIVIAIFTSMTPGVGQMITPRPPHIPSIEYLASGSKTIAIGSLIGFEAGKPMWQELGITVQVSETLKGEKSQVLEARIRSQQDNLGVWAQTQRRLLVAVPYDRNAQVTVIDLADPNLAVFTADLKLLRSEEDIVAALRRAIKTVKRPREGASFSVSIPAETIAKTALSDRWRYRTSVELDIPVDERLERWAGRQVHSRSMYERMAGLNAIRLFDPVKNRPLVEALLNDPGNEIARPAEGNWGVEERSYPVRSLAFRVLSDWGISAPKPIEAGNVSRVSEVTWLTWNGKVSDYNLSKLADAKNLKSIDLSNAKLTTAQVEKLAGLDGVVRLRLMACNVKDDDLPLLAKMRNLKSLDLADNPITDAGLESIRSFSNLIDVSLNDADVTTRGLDMLRERKHGLRVSPERSSWPHPVSFFPQTKASCSRVAYRLDPSEAGLSHWSTEPFGRLSGPIQWNKSPSGRPFIGRFGQQKVTLHVSDLPIHRNVQVEVELFIIGSWDGDGKLGAGPDILDIRVPGIGTALHSTFFNNTENSSEGPELQSFPDPYPTGHHRGYTGASEMRSLGFTEPWDGVLYHRDAVYKLKYTFAHDSPMLQIAFTGFTVPQSGISRLEDDENWGIAKIVVKTDSE